MKKAACLRDEEGWGYYLSIWTCNQTYRLFSCCRSDGEQDRRSPQIRSRGLHSLRQKVRKAAQMSRLFTCFVPCLCRFGSAAECGTSQCRDLNYREHFHCLDCNCRVFVKKEEMIRHFKWHKKRDESLQHGFMRYSPCDDCSRRFPSCAHNRKQTHYHCLKRGCDKVISLLPDTHCVTENPHLSQCYISTSDVQMHANYHRKDTAIIQEGFQRFRATEDCLTGFCPFQGQKTTHFHWSVLPLCLPDTFVPFFNFSFLCLF